MRSASTRSHDRCDRCRLHGPASAVQHRRPLFLGVVVPITSAARRPTTASSLLAIALYAAAPTFADMSSKLLFVGAFCIILSM